MNPALFHREAATPDGIPVHWGRAAVDGLPYLGAARPMTEPEYQLRTARVRRFQNGTFDVTDPAQNQVYRDVMTRIGNRRATLVYRTPPVPGCPLVYVEWYELYVSDVYAPPTPGGLT